MYRILVPLDGSRFGEQALPPALALARANNTQLALLHVLDFQHMAPEPELLDIEALHTTARDDAQRYLEQLAGEQQPLLASTITTAVRQGDPSNEIQEEASRWRADLIVMSTHGHGALDRAWLGGVADALIRESRTPVLLIRVSDRDTARVPVPFQHVLLALDGSPLAEQMIEHAVRFARTSGARITVLRVVHPWVRATRAMASAHHLAEMRDLAIEQRREQALSYVAQIARSIEDSAPAVHADAIVAETTDAAEIMKYAQQQGADVIALATRGHSGLKRLTLGSVADKLIRGASTPVLVFNPET